MRTSAKLIACEIGPTEDVLVISVEMSRRRCC